MLLPCWPPRPRNGSPCTPPAANPAAASLQATSCSCHPSRAHAHRPSNPSTLGPPAAPALAGERNVGGTLVHANPKCPSNHTRRSVPYAPRARATLVCTRYARLHAVGPHSQEDTRHAKIRGTNSQPYMCGARIAACSTAPAHMAPSARRACPPPPSLADEAPITPRGVQRMETAAPQNLNTLRTRSTHFGAMCHARREPYAALMEHVPACQPLPCTLRCAVANPTYIVHNWLRQDSSGDTCARPAGPTASGPPVIQLSSSGSSINRAPTTTDAPSATGGTGPPLIATPCCVCRTKHYGGVSVCACFGCTVIGATSV